MDFFNLSNPHLYILLSISILNGVLMGFVGYKFLQILQLSGYKILGYMEWVKDTKAKYISRVFMLFALSFACMLVTNVVFNSLTIAEYIRYVGLIFYAYFSFVFIKYMYKSPKKTPLKNTFRMNRLTVLMCVLCALVSFGLMFVFHNYVNLIGYSIISIMPLLIVIIVPLSHFISYPFEQLNRLSYINRARRKIKKMPNLIKIGITGSYGKTSVKYILNAMLSQKYNVCMSPHSFNTPMGLTKVVLNYLSISNDVLIAEMGARQVGDIKYLCSIINPKYGILTSIGNQHLRTFKTIKNIEKTKFELIASLPQEGYAVFNMDNEGSKILYDKTTINKGIVSSKDNSVDCFVSDVVYSSSGMQFKLHIFDESVECRTVLLGRHNLQNIVMSALLAKHLNVSLEQISNAIMTLKPIPHRLEIMNNNGLIILDDTFNSNTFGSECALEVLSSFSGNKIVITPGLIELGEQEYEENFNLGKKIAKVAKYCIIVNKSNLEAIKNGLIAGKMKEKYILEASTLDDAVIKLSGISKEGDTVLFENDLPDNYT